MSTNLYPRFFCDGQVGNTLSVPGSGDWNVSCLFLDRDGYRYDTTSAGTSASASAEFYSTVDRDSGFEFEHEIELSETVDGQGTLTIVGSEAELSANTSHKLYLKLTADGETIISPNQVNIEVY